jgi:hypothetical protein
LAAQAQAMGAARMQGRSPGQGSQPGMGAASMGAASMGAARMGPPGPGMSGPTGSGRLGGPSALGRPGEDWGALHARDATGMSDSRREGVAEEYRSAVETYFQVLGERATERP